MGLRHRGQDGPKFQMREKIMAIGDDFWIEDDDGNKVYKVNGKAVRMRDTFILEDASGNEVSIIQRGDRLRITADVDPDGIAALQEMLADHLRRAEERKPKRKHRRVGGAKQ